jgi:beta-glucosidase
VGCRFRIWLAVAALGLCLSADAQAQAQGRCGAHPWCDTSLSPDRRAGLLISALTPDERISLLAGDHVEGVSGAAGTHTGAADGVPRLDLPPLYLTDGPVGVRQGTATALPSSMALAASFDRSLARRHAAVVANEAKLKGNDVVYAPTVNILRTPLWGRVFESYGEDPFLTARLGVAWIRGAQAQGVIANVKHFAANNQEGMRLPDGRIIGNRFTVDARVDERTLREIYLPQFEAAVKEAGVGSVMCAYNRLNGPHACESEALLSQILRREWGFRWFVLADYGASKHVGTGLRAGLDFEPWPFLDLDGGENYTPTAVNAALAAGRANQGLVDAAVRRLLRTLFAFGFFDRAAYVDDDSRVDKVAHLRTARRVAEAGITLLKNDGALPLDTRELRSLALIGADGDRYKSGGGSSNVRPYSVVTPRQGIVARAAPGVDVRYDPGDDADRAAAVAGAADAAVVVVADTAGEFADKPCLALDCGSGDDLRRDQLIEKVAAANPRTIVVLETGGPVLTPWRDRVEGIIEAWYPGAAGGSAIAAVLFGDVNPAGRLPATFPASEQDLPTAGDPSRYPGVDDVVTYSEGLFIGYRWYDTEGIAPVFPFGHGLSYTRFRYSKLRVRRTGRHARDGFDVRFKLRNVGPRAGAEVPQVYIGPPPSPPVPLADKSLAAFDRVELAPGEATRVKLHVGARELSYWSTAAHDWVVAGGRRPVYVGSSSRDVRLQTSVKVGRDD